MRVVFVILSHSISDYLKYTYLLQIRPKVNKANNAKAQKDQQQLSRRRRQKVYHFIFEAHNNHLNFYYSKGCKNVKKVGRHMPETSIEVKATDRYSDALKKWRR